MRVAYRFLLFFFILISNVWAESGTWPTQIHNNKNAIHVELFLSSTCSHCHNADAYIRDIELSYPWLHVTRYVINEDKNALSRFNQLLSNEPVSDFAVPALFFCDSHWVGFATAETSGKTLLHALTYCKQQIEEKGELTPATVNVLRGWGHANLFNSNMTENPSRIKYLTVMALMDAFNPCALFCLGGFFALLSLQNRRKEQVISGSLFLLTLGLTHFFQQAYSSHFFELLPWLRWPAALVGLFTFYLVRQNFRAWASNTLFFLLAVLLAFFIQSYQQVCLMNWSLIFEQWLYSQSLTPNGIKLLELSFQTVYLLPLIGVFILYTLLINKERFAKIRLIIRTMGLLYLLLLSILLVISPSSLSNLPLSYLVILSTFAGGLFLIKFKKK